MDDTKKEVMHNVLNRISSIARNISDNNAHIEMKKDDNKRIIAELMDKKMFLEHEMNLDIATIPNSGVFEKLTTYEESRAIGKTIENIIEKNNLKL